MAYLVRRLLENTSNESFLRAGFLERVPEEKLLMNPLNLLKRKTEIATDKAPMNTDKEKFIGGNWCPIGGNNPFRNEPLTDFSQERGRNNMAEAMQQVWRRLGASHPLIIDGKRIETGNWIDSINPSHKSQRVGRVAAARVEQANTAVAAAKKAFPAWRDTPPEKRAELLVKTAAVLRRRRRFELAAWEVYETAKPWREADGDLAEAIDFCEYYAREMLRLATPWNKDAPGESNANLLEPRGVAVVIAPWNFPLAILCGMTVAALVTGNTVVMKPAEQSAVVGAKFMEVLEEAGFPPGVVNLLNGVGEEIGPTLTSHPDVSIIAFTGSRPVGLAIQKQANDTPENQHHVKRVITEMGGKNAVIVDDDADLDEAVHATVASAFGYAGQKCSAASRVIVLNSIYDAFLQRLIEATKSLKVGPAADPANSVGPVIDEEAHRRILTTIDRAKSQGIRLAHPTPSIGNPQSAIGNDGFYIEPHLFTDVPPDSDLAQHEIFGPVLAVIRARDLTEALTIANGTRYALTGGLFSRSPSTLARVKREFRVGNLYINRKITGALVERQPFGGYKLSGIGTKAGGPDYLPLFCWPRTITENTMRRGFAPPDETTAPAESPAGGL
jgi:RHH-type proline utilization regulon transcriptional repressor/proline dehydrogenase/delta 1-pyrroline-5-carboxylate dehydrogenase